MINIIDVVIILMILCAGIVGMKRGVFKELVMTVGYLLVFIISFYLKNPIASWMSLNLPFIDFGGAFEGMTVINIILYQFIAFIIVFSILMVIFNVVLSLTGMFEKLLNATIILGIPSKILGFVVGLIEGYILVFFVCVILSYPIFNQGVIAESKFKDVMLKYTPGLSDIAGNLTSAIDDIVELKDNYKENDNKQALNEEAIKIMVKHDVVEQEFIDKLREKGKIE